MPGSYYCEKCNRTMDENQFYTSRNLEKYPNGGKFPLCKKCLTLHVNSWEPETFLDILKEADVPYVEDEWNKILDTYGKDPAKMTGMTILGRYLSKMKLRQYKEFGWADSNRLSEDLKEKKKKAMRQSGYKNAAIAKALDQGLAEEPSPASDLISALGPQNSHWTIPPEEESELVKELTDDDRKYLRLKWGLTYTWDEYIQLEKFYEETMSSFDITTSTHIDTLKLICKTSLRAHKLIDIGDIEGFQKMSKVYDALMKSAKFTAVQNKAESGEFVDSIGELVTLCEKEGFIPRFYVEQPNDKVDATLADLRNYTKTLVYEEMNLGNLIEVAIKRMQDEESREELEDIEEEELTAEEIEGRVLGDIDYQEHFDFIEEEAEIDEQYMKSMGDVR